MNSRQTAPVAANDSKWLWLIAIATLGLGLIAFVLFILNRDTALPASWAIAGGPRSSLLDLLYAFSQNLIIPATACFLGVLIVRSQPGNRIGWLMLASGLATATAEALSEWTVFGHFPTDRDLFGATLAAWITNWFWLVLITLIFPLIAIFPSGQFLSRRWRRLIAICLFAFLVPGLLATGIESPMSSAFQIPNPMIPNGSAQTFNALFGPTLAVVASTTIVLVIQMGFRFRQSSGVQRNQIKWLLAGVVLFAVMIVTGLALNVDRPNSPQLGTGPISLSPNAPGAALVELAILALLLGIGIAMLRHQLYDIEFIIRRTTSYAVVTSLLVLVYFGTVVLLQKVFTTVSGQTSPIIVVLSTLLIAALFLPLRRRVQDIIDRRFFRSKYDAEKVLNEFAATVRDETDLDALTAELARVIQETMQPEFVNVWLVPETAAKFAPANET